MTPRTVSVLPPLGSGMLQFEEKYYPVKIYPHDLGLQIEGQ